ncbi:MAG: hypothetical protein LBG09_00635 [Puniceicoccales bacterium]|jgi:hypothetical protein|nr:hypothetical protein [Puniceicoccales bacterium]
MVKTFNMHRFIVSFFSWANFFLFFLWRVVGGQKFSKFFLTSIMKKSHIITFISSTLLVNFSFASGFFARDSVSEFGPASFLKPDTSAAAASDESSSLNEFAPEPITDFGNRFDLDFFPCSDNGSGLVLLADSDFGDRSGLDSFDGFGFGDRFSTDSLAFLTKKADQNPPPFPVIPPPPIPARAAHDERYKWTPEKDQILIKSMRNGKPKRNKDEKLKAAAEEIGYPVSACRNRWNELSPENKRHHNPWTSEEDDLLSQAVKKHGRKWEEVALCLERRHTPIACESQYLRLMKKTKETNPDADPNATEEPARAAPAKLYERHKWTPEEDKRLRELIEVEEKSWLEIANELNLSVPACQCRWHNKLFPKNQEDKQHLESWTPEEDDLLSQAVKKHGRNWEEVALCLEGRHTPMACKTRYFRLLKKNNPDFESRECYKWTPGEDDLLSRAVKKIGRNWKKVAKKVKKIFPRITPDACRQRYAKLRKKDKETNPDAFIEACEWRKWIPEEDASLRKAVRKFGRNWKEVAKKLPNRNERRCKERYAKLRKKDKETNPDADPNATEE